MDTNTKNSAIEEMAAGMVAIGTRANGKQTLSYQQAKEIVEQKGAEGVLQEMQAFSKMENLLNPNKN